MAEKRYQYSIYYKLNFLPGLLIIITFLILVHKLPSTNKTPGYLFVIALLISYAYLYFKEKLKVAKNIIISSESIIAEKYSRKRLSVKWIDIISLKYTGKGLFVVSGKISKYLYAEISSIDGQKIYIRNDIRGYNELIELIENRAGKKFST